MNISIDISGKGKNIVLIHGGAASHKDMSPIASLLNKDFKVFNIDVPGTGNSKWPDEIKTIFELAEFILQDLPDKATYIGWSFGGLLAQAIASIHPERVVRIIGLNTSPKIISDKNWVGFPAPGFVSVIEPLLKEGKTSNDFLKMFYEQEFTNFNPKPERYSEIEKLWLDKPTITNELLIRRLKIVDTTDLRTELKKITCPIDFILGEQDPSIPIGVKENIKELHENAVIHEIKGAQHAPFWTHSKEFNNILLKIISD